MDAVVLLSLMYAPADYAHPDHLPAGAPEALPAALVHQWLIDRHGLSTRIDAVPSADPLADRCVAHWRRLPRICLLMGARHRRAALLDARRYWQLDPPCRRFLALPLAGADLGVRRRDDGNHGDDCSNANLLTTGAALLAPAFRRLTPALRQRLPLLFPRAAYDAVRAVSLSSSDAAGDAVDLPLFCFAIRYARLDASLAYRHVDADRRCAVETPAAGAGGPRGASGTSG